MDDFELKERDDALLDLLNKGLIKTALTKEGEKGFTINSNIPVKRTNNSRKIFTPKR